MKCLLFDCTVRIAGRLDLEDNDGGGTRVTLILPAKQAYSAQARWPWLRRTFSIRSSQ
jgi:hypothetical protein